LAGGESKRFHGNKLLAKIDNTPIIKRVVDSLLDNVDKIYLSIRDDIRRRELENVFEGYDLEYVYDYKDLGGGPYTAIISSLDKIDSNEFLIVPGDTPWIEKKLFKKWIDIISSYKPIVSTIIWGNGVLDSLY